MKKTTKTVSGLLIEIVPDRRSGFFYYTVTDVASGEILSIGDAKTREAAETEATWVANRLGQQKAKEQ